MPRTPALPSEWPTDSVPLTSLELDPDNSRLMLREHLTDRQLVDRLIKQEEVLDLARKIAQEGGLHQHESIVVVKKGKKFIVLEGNRRTTACRILLDPTLLPTSQRGRVPSVSEEIKASIQSLRVVIAPSIEAAAPLIAALHTERGKKPWSAAAKAFHLGRMADQGRTVAEIAQSQKLKPGAVKKALLSHKLLGIAASMPGLSKEEKTLLADPRLKLNPFTRFFGLKQAKRLINLGVSDEGKLTHDGLSDSEAKAVIRAIARDMLLPRTHGGAPLFNTRVDENTIIGHQKSTRPEIAKILQRRETETNPNAVPNDGKDAGKPKIPKAKPMPQVRRLDYFQGISASGVTNNTALSNIVAEIAQFPISRFPAAGIYLQRGLVEACLVHAIRQKKLWNDFIGKHPKYGLADLLVYGKSMRTDLWQDPDRTAGFLGKWESQFKFIADQTIHVIMDGNPDTARQAAAIIRPLVEGILIGHSLKP